MEQYLSNSLFPAYYENYKSFVTDQMTHQYFKIFTLLVEKQHLEVD